MKVVAVAVAFVLSVCVVQAAKVLPSPSTSATASPSPDCFPASAEVELENGELVRMDELKVGQRVAVGKGDFSEVFMFTHEDVHVRRAFRRFHTAAGPAITVTDGHYLRVGNQLKAAAVVNVGDVLSLQTGEKTKIVAVHRVVGEGLYNPQTLHGDIVVDGIVASTYTTAVDAKIAHSALAPLRFISACVGSVFKFHNDVAALFASMLGVAGDYVVVA